MSAKAALDCMKGLISRCLINSYISRYDFNLINYVLRKYNDMKIYITKNIKMKEIYCVICGKYRKLKNPKVS